MEERNYLIIDCSDIPTINFSEVMESSEDTLRKSNDETKTFIKWMGITPSFYGDLTSPSGPYTHSEILAILRGADWTTPNNQG